MSEIKSKEYRRRVLGTSLFFREVRAISFFLGGRLFCLGPSRGKSEGRTGEFALGALRPGNFFCLGLPGRLFFLGPSRESDLAGNVQKR